MKPVLMSLILAMVCLTGCQYLAGAICPSSDASLETSQAGPMEFQGVLPFSGVAKKGQKVELSVIGVAAAEQYLFGPLAASVDETAKTVTISGTMLEDMTSCRTFEQLVYTKALSVAFTPESTGTYVVTAQPLDTDIGLRFMPEDGQVAPAASTTVEVTE